MSKKLVWYSKNAEHIVNNVTVYNKEFSYKDGFVYIDNLSEQLDSATVVLPFIEKQQFEPFDIVELYDDRFGYKTMLIDNIDEMQVNVDDDSMFDYTLPLMSLTKALERITLPNISITRRESGIPKTLYQVLKELLEDYSPKILTENGYEQLYSIEGGDDNHDVRLNDICPELQMSKPTLREAIDRVLSVIYCISKVNENHEIELFDINQKNNPIILENTPEINYKDETQSTTDYASELENQYNNVTPNKNPLLKNYTLITEWIGFRNNGQMVLTTNNIRIETSKPIYLIKKVIMFGVLKGKYEGQSADHTETLNYDITEYIYEKEAYDALDYNTQIVSLYYSRGSKNITNFSYESGWWIFNSTVIERLIERVSGLVGLNGDQIISQLAFKVEYYAQDETIRGKSGKYLPETNENNSIVDNPTEAFVDIQKQGESFNQKVNRLGNRAKIMTGRFTDYNRIPILGDYYGDYIVMNRELQFYDDFINVKLTLTQDFVNINYFTGINARIRSWQIVSASEAFNKQLLDKWYCEFSFNIKSDYDNISPGVSAEYLLNAFTYTSKPILRSIVTNNSIKNGYSDDKKYVELELSSYISGNSLIFNFNFDDNYTAGLSINESVTGGVAQNYNKYVDINGEEVSFDFILVNEIPVPNYVTVVENWPAGYRDFDSDIYESFKSYSCLKPRLLIENYDNLDKIYEKTIYNHKDNREKININVQFEFCSDTRDIIIGKKFLERQNAVSTLHANNTDINETIPALALFEQPVYEEVGELTGTIQVQATGQANTQVVDISESGVQYTDTATIPVTETTRRSTSYGTDDNTITWNGTYYETQTLSMYINELSNTNASVSIVCDYGIPGIIVSQSGNTLYYKLQSPYDHAQVDGSVIVSWDETQIVQKTLYQYRRNYSTYDTIYGTPTINNNGISYPGVTGTENKIEVQQLGGLTYLYITVWSETPYIAYTASYEKLINYRTVYTKTIDTDKEDVINYSITGNSTISLVRLPTNRLAFRGTIVSNSPDIDETITYTYYDHNTTIIGWKGYGTLTVPELRYVENVRDVTITGDSRNTVSYNNGIFSYEVYSDSTSRPLLPFIGTISFTYNYGQYKVYSCPSKYKYGEQTLKTGSVLFDSYSVDVSSETNSTAKLVVSNLTGGLGSSQNSIAIVDGNNNLILAINTEDTEVTCYLNLLRTRDRKVYTDKTLKHFNS